MSVRLQEKLLRVIEYGEFERVGSSETLRTDVRLVGAANQDLPALARRGKFREDLLDRLSFDVITLPPLRARAEDILLLADRFGRSMAQELGHDFFPGFSPSVERQLMSYRWPGNVRELRNVVDRAVYRNPRPTQPIESLEIDPFASPFRPPELPAEATMDAAPAAASAPSTSEESSTAHDLPLAFKDVVERFEVGLLNQAMEEARYNQRKAAELLELSYHQLRGLLRKYDLLDKN